MFYDELKIEVLEPESDLENFKNLILKRDKLKKDEQTAYVNYVQRFGELLEKRFSLQIDCIKTKKMITLCQAKTNRGEREISLSSVEQEVNTELEEYYQELRLLQDIANAERPAVPEYDFLLIKRKYKRIAMAVHPDLHGDYADDETLMELWEKAKTAYECNDLQALEEAEVLIFDYLKTCDKEIEVENIKEKIRKIETEIENIVSNDPYRYKYILSDHDAIVKKTEELKSDIEEYQSYLSELQEKLNAFNLTKELFVKYE